MTDAMNERGPAMLSIGAVSRATGIPVPTIRTWERRYGFPVPHRKESGHRLYGPEVVAQLQLIADALSQGHRPSQVVALPAEELRDLLQSLSTPERTPGPPVGQLPSSGTAGVADENVVAAEVETWVDSVLRLDGDALEVALRRRAATTAPVEFAQRWVAPFVDAVGLAWADGRASVSQEHEASERVRAVLADIWRGRTPRPDARVVVLSTLSGEHHQLGLHMAAIAFTEAGWRPVFLGMSTPVIDIAGAALEAGAAAVAVSVSVAADPTAAARELIALRRVLPDTIGLAVGGRGAPEDLEGVRRFSDIVTLFEWARQFS